MGRGYLADPKNKDGLFDFKLSIGNDAFTTPPTMYTGPDRNWAAAVKRKISTPGLREHE